MTAVLRIQHSVPQYDGWKRAFDADPVERRGGGVRLPDERSLFDPRGLVLE